MDKLNYLTSVKDMYRMQAEPSSWIVDGLLRTGRRRISLLAGKPESGKSTLARQLCVAVAQGEKFLGRATVQGEVMLWQCEDDLLDLRESFQRLGYNPNVDAPIHVLNGESQANTVKNFGDALDTFKNVKLVVIETLDDLLQITDVKENTAAREAFERFDGEFGKHYSQVACVALHHLRKRDDSYDSGDRLLGASVIRGKTDAKIFLDKISDDDDRRIIHATVRRGVPIPKTFLEYDAATETSTLGQTYAAFKANGAAQTASRIEDDLLRFIASNPGASLETIVRSPLITGNTAAKRTAFKRLLANTRIAKQGRGVKNSPAGYDLVELPVEIHEQSGVAA